MHKGYAQDSAKGTAHGSTMQDLPQVQSQGASFCEAFEVLWVVWAGESTRKFYEHSHPPTL